MSKTIGPNGYIMNKLTYLYRTPGSDMQTFIDQIETVIKNVTNVKKIDIFMW